MLESKDRVKENIRKWRKGTIEKGESSSRKTKHVRILRVKTQKEKERHMEEVGKAVKEQRGWKVLNRREEKGRE